MDFEALKSIRKYDYINTLGHTQYTKIFLIIGYLLITINGLTLYLSPLPYYVPSFYTYLPITFWIFSVVIFIGSSILLLSNLNMKTSYKTLLFLLVFINNFLILFSMLLCGAYLTNGGDTPTYAGMAIDILQFQEIDYNTIFYPLIPIYTGIISIISGISCLAIINMLSPFFSLLFPIYLYIISKNLFNNEYIDILSYLVGSTLFLSGIFPVVSATTIFGLSLLTLPILIILIIKKEKHDILPYAILLIIFLLAYVLYHPLTGFLLFFTLLALLLIRLYFRQKIDFSLHFIFPIVFSAYMFFVTVVWKRPMSYVTDFLDSYENDYLVKEGYRVDVSQNVEKIGLNYYDLISLAIKMFGHQALLIFCIFIFFIFVILAYNKRYTLKKYWIQITYCWVLVSLLLFIIQVVKPLFIISFYRFLYCMILFAPIIFSVIVKDLIKIPYKKILTIIILSSLFIWGMLTVYPSPYISQANPQVTYSDYSGAIWSNNKKIIDDPIIGYFGSGITKRIMSGILPYRNYLDNKNYGAIGNHLDYSYYTLGGLNNIYIVITNYDLIVYTGVYSNIGRLNFNDIQKFNSDTLVSKVYNNGGYTLYAING